MTTSHFDNEDTITEEDDDLDFLALNKEEVRCLLDECKYSYISYQNPIARSVIRKMSNFLNCEEIIEKR